MARKSKPRKGRTDYIVDGWRDWVKHVFEPHCCWSVLYVGWLFFVALIMLVTPPLRTVVGLLVLAALPVIGLFLMGLANSLRVRFRARR